MGKGIGFQKKPGDIIDKDKIEKIFSLSKEHTDVFEELVEKMPYEHIRLNLMKEHSRMRDSLHTLSFLYIVQLIMKYMMRMMLNYSRCLKNVILKHIYVQPG